MQTPRRIITGILESSGSGITIFDYDGDGDKELYLLNYGPNVFYKNNGDLDVIVSHVDLEASSVLLRNDSNNDNHWLGLTMKGKDGATELFPGPKTDRYISLKRGTGTLVDTENSAPVQVEAIDK